MTALLIFILNIAAAFAAVILVDRHVSRSTTADDEDARSVEFGEYNFHTQIINSREG